MGNAAVSYKHGELFTLADGEYEDYRVRGLYKCLRDLDMGELARSYHDQCAACNWDDDRKDASAGRFGAWLVRNGHVDELDYDEIDCGGYNSFDPDDIAEQANNRDEEIAKG